MEGDIENVGGCLRITRIRVTYHLIIAANKRAEADRALALHADKCPAALSVKDCIAIETRADITET